MSPRRRRTGRVKIAFEKIEAIAAAELVENAFAKVMGCQWTLTKHSALYRNKAGLYTLCLVWHGPERQTLTSTMRGLKLEAV